MAEPNLDIREVDPAELRVPSSKMYGADPGKLQYQIHRFGRDIVGDMPLIEVREAADGVLVISNGVTRATRIAKLSPGTLVRVVVMGPMKNARATAPRIGELLP